MRGLAAIVVVLYHGTMRTFPMGYAAVDLFFLLSGFVLAHRHADLPIRRWLARRWQA